MMWGISRYLLANQRRRQTARQPGYGEKQIFTGTRCRADTGANGMLIILISLRSATYLPHRILHTDLPEMLIFQQKKPGGHNA